MQNFNMFKYIIVIIYPLCPHVPIYVKDSNNRSNHSARHLSLRKSNRMKCQCVQPVLPSMLSNIGNSSNPCPNLQCISLSNNDQGSCRNRKSHTTMLHSHPRWLLFSYRILITGRLSICSSVCLTLHSRLQC